VRRYIFKRLRRGLITLWLTTLAVFMLLRITGNPLDFLATPQISPEDVEVLKVQYGFDKPIYVQYLIFLLFTVYLGWLPSAGGPERVGLQGLLMPAVSLGWFLVAANTRLVRSSMLDALDSDYIKMVRAKGLRRRAVIWKHALKNAALPIITLFAANFALLLGGAVVTESIFAWPGIGRLLVESVFARDYTVIQTVVFFSAIIIVIVNILVDVCYAWLDPRVRLE
jgi:peptide/nickel transport system permease protein